MSETHYEMGHGEAAQGREPQTGVTLYRPIIIAVMYLLNLMFGFTVLVGLILAYVWRNDEETTEWEETHFTYLIRTFWIGFWIIILMIVAVVGGAIALSAGFPITEHLGDHDGPPPPAIIGMVFGCRCGISCEASSRLPMRPTGGPCPTRKRGCSKGLGTVTTRGFTPT